MSTPESSLIEQVRALLAAQYEEYRGQGLEEPLRLEAVLWTLDDLIADAADPDYAEPDQARLRDLTTLRALCLLLRGAVGDLAYPPGADTHLRESD